MTTKEALHRLIDELPDRQLVAALALLERLRRGHAGDLMLDVLEQAPEDNETTTADEDESSREGWRAYRQGNYISAEVARKELLG
jgi:hypothetical protein